MTQESALGDGSVVAAHVDVAADDEKRPELTRWMWPSEP